MDVSNSIVVGVPCRNKHLVVYCVAIRISVAALMTASTLTVTDVPTPYDYTITMAPINSTFAAGMCVELSVGRNLAYLVGVATTSTLVGCAFAVIAGLLLPTCCGCARQCDNVLRLQQIS